MKRATLTAAFVLAAALALVPASAALSAPLPGPVINGVNDFEFDSMRAEYELSLDDEGRSVLVTTETLVAVFPESDQNRGIQRAVPTQYLGRGIDTQLLGSVTDENGNQLPTEVEFTSGDDDGDFMIVTSRASGYLHGAHTYVISYEQHNVTHVPDNANAAIDEFYWDVNGTGWKQPFGEVMATLRVSPELAANLTGAAACYQGYEGSAVPCERLDFTPEAGGEAPVLIASAGPLLRGQNLTISVAFEPGTIVPKDDSLAASAYSWPGLVAGALALLSALAAMFVVVRASRSHAGRGTIIAEYLPPRGVNVLVASDVSGTGSKARSALLIDLAVRHKLAILEGSPTEFLLEFRDANGLDEQELAAVRGFFAREYPNGVPVGAVTAIKKVDPAAAKRLQRVDATTAERVIGEGYRVRRRPRGRMLTVWGSFVLGGIAVVSGVAMGSSEVAMPFPAIVIAAGALSVLIAFFTLRPIKPLTERGAELRDYLKGLELYIRVAEQDRLRVLQSPDGALRSEFRPQGGEEVRLIAAASESQPLAVIKLYERLLPYAILFGQEKQWGKALGDAYAQNGVQPDWWGSQNGFNVVLFASAVSGFSSSTNQSWASSSSSSSGSGSGGGGFSGGGGGGGGGGGV